MNIAEQDMIPGIAVTPDSGVREYHLLTTRQEWLTVMHLRGAHGYDNKCPMCRVEFRAEAASDAASVWQEVADLRAEKLADVTKRLNSIIEGN